MQVNQTPDSPRSNNSLPETAKVVNRIAMWSGPRNISTAMMRSFGNRSDTDVCDEPFYACYLKATGYDHPIAEQVVASQSADWPTVVQQLIGPSPTGKPVWYQKQMAHHMLPGQEMEWMQQADFHHLFLVRDPRAMLLSLSKVIGDVTIEQTGLPQQREIFDKVHRATGVAPPVIDSRQVLNDPAVALKSICQQVGIEFQTSMLSWPKGPRDTDGVWGPHWYRRLYETTGFSTEIIHDDPLPPSAAKILDECLELYDGLMQHRLQLRT